MLASRAMEHRGHAPRIYAESALRSLPRLLSLQDRNPLSTTYGCFHRDYWLYKTADFPDAVRQFAVHALALAYAYDFGSGDGGLGPRHTYYRNSNLRDWAIAALNFWAGIQHADGSFDEFYPHERGWVGPTAFTAYASAESLRLLRAEMSPETICRVEASLRRAAHFIARGETEEDHLGNHHAMAYLAVSTAADVLEDPTLRASLPTLWQSLLRYQHDEGWFTEYDGADPGYLSATISFLAKVYQRHPTEDLRRVLKPAVDFASYFVYPDGTYAGMTGSRNTVHCYPHGFELLAPELPTSAAIAERIARATLEGTLVPPEIMSDRYVHYRVPEFLLAALDSRPRPRELPLLPGERTPFTKVFPAAGIVVSVHGSTYTTVNLKKGGVITSVSQDGTGRLSDTGWIGELADRSIVASQWLDPRHQISVEGSAWSVDGHFTRVPSTKPFTLWTHLAFRLALGLLGSQPRAAHWLKGRIRKMLILGTRPVSARFHRRVEIHADRLVITDHLANPQKLSFQRLLLGGEIPLRFVPQSRFFQPHELDQRSQALTAEQLARLNAGHPLRLVRTVAVPREAERPPVTQRATGDTSVRNGKCSPAACDSTTW